MISAPPAVAGEAPRARRIAVDLLQQVEGERVSFEMAVDGAGRRYGLGLADRGDLKDLLSGVVRRLNTVDWIVQAHLLQRRLEEVPLPVKHTLRIGVYQLIYMRDRVPAADVVEESQALAKEFGHDGIVSLVNATLRSVQEHRDNLLFPDEKQSIIKHLNISCSHPEWLVRRWITQYGLGDTRALCELNNGPSPVCLRVNTLKTTRDGLTTRLIQSGLPYRFGTVPEAVWVDDPLELDTFAPFLEGWCHVQDEAAQLVAHLLSPRPGETVLDACAAPGGMTTHLAALMQNQGRILAMDEAPHKMNGLRENCERLGAANVEFEVSDPRQAGARFPRAFDRALLDAPCSGTGIIRRHPELRWRKSIRDVTSSLPALQYAHLESVAQTVKTKGILVYATRSLEPEENEQVVRRFLDAHPVFELQEPPPTMPVGTERFVDLEGFVRFYPHRDGTDGVFAARLRRVM